MKSLRSEPAAIALFLAGAAAFGFVLLPIGIQVGSANAGAGLSPRFLPQLATASLAIALVWGLFRAVAGRGERQPADQTDGSNPRKPLVAATICMAFAIGGFDLAGFYLGGFVMAVLLTLLLGERRVLISIVFPTLLLAVIYLVFEIGLQVRLPKSGLFPGLAI